MQGTEKQKMKHNWMPIAALVLFAISRMTGGGGILPNDSPVDVDSPHVLVVWEQQDIGNLSREQFNVIQDIQSRAELCGIVESAGGQIRLYDDDVGVPVESELEDEWKEMLSIERESLPWIVIATPTGGTSEGLPESVAATKALIEEYL